MKLRYVLRALTSPPLPPIMQPAIGNKADNAWLGEPPSGGFLETLFGWGSDGKLYEMDAADQRRLRPILLPDPRAERNRAIAAERARRRARGEPDRGMVSFANDAPQRAPGAAPEAYSLDAFPMSDEAKAFYGGGSVKRDWGPRHHD